MRKTMITIILGIVIISLVSAMYAGESETFDLGFEIVNCSIINNTYDLEGLNLSWHEKNVTILTVQNYKPDNFTISCWVIKYKDVIEEYTPRRGGSSCRYNENFDWKCSEWGACVNETQSRTCKKYNNCRSIYGKPNETQNCSIEEKEEGQEEDTEEEPIEAEEEKKSLLLFYILCGIIILAIIFMWYRVVKKQNT